MASLARRGRREVDAVGRLAASAVKTTLWQTFDISAELIGGTLAFAFEVTLRFEAFLVLFAIAETIIFLRYLVAHFAWVAEAAAVVLVGLVDTLVTAWRVIAICVRVATLGIEKLPMLKTYTVSDLLGDNWYTELQNVPVTCRSFVEWEAVFTFFAGQLTRDNICPFLRYVQPVPWLYRLMDALLGWVSVDPTPQPGNNCNDPVDQWLCAIFGTGYLILQLLIPLLLGLIALKCYAPVVRKIVRWVVDFIYFILVRLLLRGLLRAEYDLKRLGSEASGDFRRFWMHRHA